MRTRVRKHYDKWVCEWAEKPERAHFRVQYCDTWKEAFARAVAVEHEPYHREIYKSPRWLNVPIAHVRWLS